MFSEIIKNKKKLNQIFEKHKLEKVYVFGSVLNQNFNNNSDIDFLIKFKNNIKPLEKGELWWNLHDTLRNLFNREIDILTEKSLKNPYLIKELNETKKLIYGQ